MLHVFIFLLCLGGPPSVQATPSAQASVSAAPSWPAQIDSAAVWTRNQQLISIQWAARKVSGPLAARTPRQVFDSRLAVIAFNQARYCASIGTLTHTRPDGSSPFPQLAAIGYPYPKGQENGWMGGVASDGTIWPWTPDDVVMSWLGSRVGHRENVLGDYNQAGFGWAYDRSGRLFVFGCYGKR